jgi:hypothetical protein
LIGRRATTTGCHAPRGKGRSSSAPRTMPGSRLAAQRRPHRRLVSMTCLQIVSRRTGSSAARVFGDAAARDRIAALPLLLPARRAQARAGDAVVMTVAMFSSHERPGRSALCAATGCGKRRRPMCSRRFRTGAARFLLPVPMPGPVTAAGSAIGVREVEVVHAWSRGGWLMGPQPARPWSRTWRSKLCPTGVPLRPGPVDCTVNGHAREAPERLMRHRTGRPHHVPWIGSRSMRVRPPAGVAVATSSFAESC